MKKLMFTAGALLLSGSLWAACYGPFCFDDTGAAINGVVQNGAGSGVPLMTKANVLITSPLAKGQHVFCTDCLNFNAQKGMDCVSTGTVVGSYMAVSSATAVSSCQ